MKTRLFIALAGLAISFALPIFAQTNKPDPQLREKLVAVVKDFTDAVNNNAAAVVAPLFTEDAVLVHQKPLAVGRPLRNRLRTCSRECMSATLSSRSIRIPLTL